MTFNKNPHHVNPAHPCNNNFIVVVVATSIAIAPFQKIDADMHMYNMLQDIINGMRFNSLGDACCSIFSVNSLNLGIVISLRNKNSVKHMP